MQFSPEIEAFLATLKPLTADDLAPIVRQRLEPQLRVALAERRRSHAEGS